MTYIPLWRDHERKPARYIEACRQFRAGEITEAVFKATLYGLGTRTEKDLSTKISLTEPPTIRKTYAASGFVSGLPD